MVPSGSTVGSITCAPTPSVFGPSSNCFTYASTGFFMGVFCLVVLRLGTARRYGRAGRGAAHPDMDMAVIPAASWPEIWQYAVYMPVFRIDTSRLVRLRPREVGVLRSCP